MDSGGNSPVSLGRSSSLRTYSANRTSLVRRNQSLSAKQIRFYRNGDRYFAGLKLAVSTERYKEFDSLLAELSEKLNLSTGAVRYVFNADDNGMITDISQLQYGIPYVCSSSNTFRQIEGGYGKHLHSWSIIAKSKQHNSNKFNGHFENINGSFRLDTSRDFIKPKLVTVIRNGKPPQKKVTLLLNTKTAISLDQVLDQLSAKGSLGKVDKLYTVDGRSIKTLRDLFEDDTVFIALSTNEKFPEDGIELDPNSYRITPYRELKRPSCMTVRRSNSLRGSIRRYKDENENMSISKIAKGLRSNHGVHSAKAAQNVARPRGSALKKIDQNKEELYPTSVFESDSDSARAKIARRVRAKGFQSMDIYNTVWLSDFESVHSSGTRSGFSSLNQSRVSFPENNLGHSTPRCYTREKVALDDNCPSRSTSKNRLHRTLSLPESDLATLNGDDLQERFSRLQLEQENRELRLLVRQLQEALEKLEKAMVNNLTKNAESSFQPACSTCTLCTEKKVEDKSPPVHVDSKLAPAQSPDSLEESNSKDGSEKEFQKFKERNESGYNTFTNDSMQEEPLALNDDQDYKLKEYQYMEYSDSMSYSSEEERQYLQSRLIKRRGYYDDYDDEGTCCILQ